MSKDLQKLATDISLINNGGFLVWQGIGGVWKKDNLKALSENLPCNNYLISGKKLSRCLFPLTDQPRPLQCFVDENEEVVLLRLEDAKSVATPDKLIESLGAPEEAVILSNNSKYAPAKQLIYADRGITLYVLGDIKTDKIMLMAVSLYSPTSVENYKNNLCGIETDKFFKD